MDVQHESELNHTIEESFPLGILPGQVSPDSGSLTTVGQQQNISDSTSPDVDEMSLNMRKGSQAPQQESMFWPWSNISRWFRANTFTPLWLPGWLRHPVLGSLVATLLQIVAIFITLSLVQLFPIYSVAGLLQILVVALIALTWGAVPSLVATLVGAGLLEYVILPPHFSWTPMHPEDLLQVFLFLVVGLVISIVASRIERARRNAQELATSLETERARLDAILETVPDAVSIFDEKGKLVHLNRAGRGYVGPYRGNETLANIRQAYDIRKITGEPFPAEELPVVQALEGKMVSDVELRYRGAEERDRYVTVSAAPLLDAQGKIDGVVMITHDISEHRQFERRTHETLNALLQMAEALVSIPDERTPTGELMVGASQKVAQRLAELTCSVLGCKRVAITAVEPETHELRSMAVVGLPPEQEQEWRARTTGYHLSDMFADESHQSNLLTDDVLLLDIREPPFNKRPNPFGISLMLLAPMYVGSQLVGLLSVDHGGEVHEYTSDERALTKAVAKLAALVIERERLLRDRAEARANELALREANRRMDEFLGMTSHELKTPLTSIKGNTQLAARQLRNSLQGLEKMQGMLEGTERQVRLLNRLVDDLLDIARTQGNHLELQRKLCELAAITREAVEEQRKAWPARTIRLEMVEGIELPVYADADRIGQVITNYLTNALKYSDEGKPVDVTVRREGDEAVLSVQDKGPGLSEEQQADVWERFQRIEGVEVHSNPHGSTVGLGLGLYISKIIIEQHGGHVGVQSIPAEGSMFWFRLPLQTEGQLGIE